MSSLGIGLDEARSSLRGLARQPGFMATAVVPLALAMTLAALTFGVVDVVLLRPLPYANAERIVSVGEPLSDAEAASGAMHMVDGPVVEVWERETQTMATFALYHRGFQTLTRPDGRVRIPTAAVGVRFFDVLGVPPLAGRYFQAADEASARDRPVVVISFAFWQQILGADPDVVGRTIVLDDVPSLVVGIAPRELRIPSKTSQVWTLRQAGERPSGTPQHALGRLRPGATPAAAAAEGTVIAQRERAALALNAPPPVIEVVPLPEIHAAAVRRGLLLFSGAALLVLASAALHVGHLFVVYGQRRRREFAVRAALGASRLRLGAMALIAVAAVTIAAAALATLLTVGLHGVLPAVLPPDFPRIDDVAFTGRSLLAILAAAVLTTLVGATIVIRYLGRSAADDSASAIDAGGLRSSARVRTRSGRVLLAGEVAFSAALLMVAGLLARSFIGLAMTDSGYEPEGALTAQVSFPSSMPQLERRQVVERMLATLSTMPSVVHAGTSNALPLEDVKIVFRVDGFTGEDATSVDGDFGVVSPGYLEALGATIVEGRGLTWDDREGRPGAALVNRAFVSRYLAGREPLGLMSSALGTIVGVVDDVRLSGPTAVAGPAVYVSVLQRAQATFFDRVNLVVRTTGDPLAIAGGVRDVVRATDDRLALADVTTLDRQLSDAVARPRLYATMLVVCATLALLIVVIGVFASLAYAAARRRREVAIRLAIGARRKHVAAMLARDAIVVTGLGLAIGIGAGLMGGRALASLLHGVSPSDPMAPMVTVVLLAGAAMLAGAVPIAGVLRTDLARELRAD